MLNLNHRRFNLIFSFLCVFFVLVLLWYLFIYFFHYLLYIISLSRPFSYIQRVQIHTYSEIRTLTILWASITMTFNSKFLHYPSFRYPVELAGLSFQVNDCNKIPWISNSSTLTFSDGINQLAPSHSLSVCLTLHFVFIYIQFYLVEKHTAKLYTCMLIYRKNVADNNFPILYESKETNKKFIT